MSSLVTAGRAYEFKPIDNVLADPNNPEELHPDATQQLQDFNKRIDTAITKLRNLKKKGIEKFMIKHLGKIVGVEGDNWQDENLEEVKRLEHELSGEGIQKEIWDAGQGNTELGKKLRHKADRYARFPLSGQGGGEDKEMKNIFQARWADTDMTVAGKKKMGGRKKRRRKSRKKKRKSRKKKKTKRRRKSRKKRTKRRRR